MADDPALQDAQALNGRQRFDTQLWLAWMGATVLGWAAGEFVFRVFADAVWGAAWLRGGDGVGVFVAVLQALVLRRHLTQPVWWVVAGGVGGVLSPFLSTLINATVYAAVGVHVVFVLTLAVTALGAGILVGTLQWMVLRRETSQAGRWVSSSARGMFFGGFVGRFIGLMLVGSSTDVLTSDLVGGLLSAAIYGAITAYAMVRLLQYQAPDRELATATAP
ncbi:MAG: hypothetical protein OXG17_08715 [Chloroflexi bacterium]|nr:hypothetical protein [Chloroflexota bacterium]